jgi:hypothetical protein
MYEYICMHACIYVCMIVCMHVCMYVYVCMFKVCKSVHHRTVQINH